VGILLQLEAKSGFWKGRTYEAQQVHRHSRPNLVKAGHNARWDKAHQAALPPSGPFQFQWPLQALFCGCGGHVVLSLLVAETVGRVWLGEDQFPAGYGAAQALPGPLFTFAAYLSALKSSEPNGNAGALLALAAIFAHGFLVLTGAVPYWDRFRAMARAQSLLRAPLSEFSAPHPHLPVSRARFTNSPILRSRSIALFRSPLGRCRREWPSLLQPSAT